jgi:hypothetical protein
MMTTLVHYSILGGIVFGEDGFLALSRWCMVFCYKEHIVGVRIFFSVILVFGCVLPYCR